MLAVGMDPDKGIFYGMVRTADGEHRWRVPLTKQMVTMFKVVRAMLA